MIIIIYLTIIINFVIKIALLMKVFKNIVLPIIVIVGLTVLFDCYKYEWIVALSILFSVYILSGIFRYKRWMLNYFLSPLSFLHGKVREQIEVDLPPNLLFEKILEYYRSRKAYRIINFEEELLLNAGTPFTGLTWTENIIIKIRPSVQGNGSVLDFTSLTFALFSWGKNEENLNELKSELDQSFFVV